MLYISDWGEVGGWGGGGGRGEGGVNVKAQGGTLLDREHKLSVILIFSTCGHLFKDL